MRGQPLLVGLVVLLVSCSGNSFSGIPDVSMFSFMPAGPPALIGGTGGPDAEALARMVVENRQFTSQTLSISYDDNGAVATDHTQLGEDWITSFPRAGQPEAWEELLHHVTTNGDTLQGGLEPGLIPGPIAGLASTLTIPLSETQALVDSIKAGGFTRGRLSAGTVTFSISVEGQLSGAPFGFNFELPVRAERHDDWVAYAD
jgi:hypothetical protein